MKRQKIKKMFISGIAIILAISCFLPTAFGTTVYAGGTDLFGYHEDSPQETLEKIQLKEWFMIQDNIGKWEKKQNKEKKSSSNTTTKKKTKGLSKNDVKKAYMDGVEATIKAFDSALPEIKSMIENGEVDGAVIVDDIVSLASGIIAAVPIWGGIASAGINLLNKGFKMFMGGEVAPSEMVLLEDNLTQQFNDMKNDIADIEDELGEISNQINESINVIVSSVTTAIENNDSKGQIRDFMLSTGVGDFSYKNYVNAIYGTTKNNSSATTAYYMQYNKSLYDGSSEEEQKYYCDKLYSSLWDYRDMFRDYIIGDGISKPIVQCYYDVVSSRPDIAEKLGMSPEVAALQFAYDIYQTQIRADMCIMSCNEYQYIKMGLNGTDYYDYGTGRVTKKEIYGNGEYDSISEQLFLREDEIISQLSVDLAYILGIDSSYIVRDTDGELYYQRTEELSNGIHAAKVLDGQTVYLNRIPQGLCSLFDIDYDMLVYTYGENYANEDGIVEIIPDTIGSVATLQYGYENGKKLSSIMFIDATESSFSGGSGTISDPYLVSTKEQFMNISEGLDKSYKLIRDIDFEKELFYPIGYRINSTGKAVYDEFLGSIDGNGHKISNMVLKSGDFTGIVAILGYNGIIENLSVSQIGIDSPITFLGEDKVLSAGIICGESFGKIKKCEVNSCTFSLLSNTSNEGANRTVTHHVGGIVGNNYGIVSCVKVSSSEISASSNHNYKGASEKSNSNSVYTGGLCGYNNGIIEYAIVSDDVSIKANACSEFNTDTSAYPYITTYAGGIFGFCDSINKKDLLSYLFVDSKAIIYASSKYKQNSRWKVHDKNIYEYSSLNELPKEDGKVEYSVQGIESMISSCNKSNSSHTFDCHIKNDDNVYEIGEEDFKESWIYLSIDGQLMEFIEYNDEEKEQEYDKEKIVDKIDDVLSEPEENQCKVLQVYGFDTGNNTLKEVNRDLTLILWANLNGEDIFFDTTLRITIEADHVVDFEPIEFRNEYSKNEKIPPITAGVNLYYKSGSVPNEAPSYIQDASFEVIENETVTSEYGEKNVTLKYGNVEKKVMINVICGTCLDCDYYNDEHFEQLDSVSETCQHIGYDVYRCIECGTEYKTNYRSKTDHNYRIRGDKPATCHTVGYTGEVYCSYCGTIFEENTEIPMLNHTFTYKDVNSHYCTNDNCNTVQSHDYVVSESIVDGVLTYTYTCRSCGYIDQETDTNIITNEKRMKPVVTVSDGYALKGGDVVTIYVQLVNNPGVTGANFGIRYDERLQLVTDPLEGTVFESVASKDMRSVNCGCNFVWADKDSKTNDGNLLKLIFKLPKDAKAGEEYEVSVVYSVVDGSEGGFSIDRKVLISQGFDFGEDDIQKFLTRKGTIRVVDDALPGDVNYDKKVDMLDVLELAERLVDTGVDENTRKTGDVNRSGQVNVQDLVELLQSMNGGYGVNLLYPKYNILLNTNGFDADIPDYFVANLFAENDGNKVNNGNNTYSALEDIEGKMMRNGYKFLGWYTRIEGGNKIEYSSPIKYDANQEIQTLYAHWEKNEISFDMNGATSEQLEPISYIDGLAGQQISVFEKPYEQYAITFQYIKDKTHSDTTSLEHEFLGWSDGNNLYKSRDLSEPNIGKVTLRAVWDKWHMDTPELGVGENTGMQYFTSKYKLGGNDAGPAEDDWSQEFKDQCYNVIKQHELIFVDWAEGASYSACINYNDGARENTIVTSYYAGDFTSVFTVPNPTRMGYTFAGWNITGMNENVHMYIENDTNTFTEEGVTELHGIMATRFGNLRSEEGVVTFTAQWIPNTYKVRYELGKNAFIDKELDKDNYTTEIYDNEFVVPNPTRVGYSFAGWAISTSQINTTTMKETFINVCPDPKSDGTSTVTFTATWKLNPYEIGKCVGSESTGKYGDYFVYNGVSKIPLSIHSNNTNDSSKIIFNFEGSGSILTGKTITINSPIDELFIIGNPNTIYDNFNIILSGYENSVNTFKIHLVNVKFENSSISNNYNNLVSGNRLSAIIECVGNCAVKSSDRDAIGGFENVMINGTGIMIAEGGTGKSGINAGDNGSDGFNGINILGNLVIDFDGTVEISGGKGGDGATGKPGNTGKTNDDYYKVKCNYGIFGIEIQTINCYYQAYSGTDGGNGGNGGDGGQPIVCNTINIQNGNMIMRCGSGGKGGTGGTGGTGGKGHDYYGYAKSVSYLICYDPGVGGNAGNGGQGGNGGHPGASVMNKVINGQAVSYDGTGGEAGGGGAPGTAGTGGNGGSTHATANDHSAGKANDGAPGSWGTPGQPG